MKGEWDSKKEESKNETPLEKGKFDLDRFLRESVRAGEILEKKEREREREHAEV
jgi:hypothetical protein